MVKEAKKYDKRVVLSRLTALAFLIALEVVLTRLLSLHQWNMRFSFGFIPVVVAGIMYGPIAGATVGAFSDFIGANLIPMGAYFPGFTVTALLTGLTFGLFLYKKQTVVNIVIATLLTQIICSLILNSLFISILYGSPYRELVISRLLQTVIMSGISIVVIRVISKDLLPRLKMAMAR
jgi:ECF transporter S component (folate family)